MKLADLLEDIASAPNFEGLAHKSKQALATFSGKQAQEAIEKAVTDRQKALSDELGKKTASSESGSARKLFEKTYKFDGVAA